MNNKTILIVDPIHSAPYLSRKMQEHGVRTVALFSDMSNIAEFNRPAKNLFDKQIHIKDESIETILTMINEPIDFVLNGCDQHVGFCEKIAFALNASLANNPESYLKRESKFFQQEAMKEQGLPHIKQVLMSREAPDFNLLNDFSYPVFAKPANGGGSIGIFKASSFDDFVTKFNQAPRMVNFDPIENYLVQEFVDGTEIIIDAFSHNGNHAFSHVFTYQKKLVKGTPVYRTIETLDDSDLTHQALEFAKGVLNACEYHNGFSHIELFYTSHGDFKLIELNPRISGASGLPNMMADIVGLKSQDSLLAEFLHTGTANSSDFSHQKGVSKSLLIYNHEAMDFSSFESYQSHIDITPIAYNEERAPDLTDLRKIVFVYHEDKQIVEKESELILDKDIF